ncbi:probable galacturonosyltransferase 13 isoform X1 [Tanacetum coccineum]
MDKKIIVGERRANGEAASKLLRGKVDVRGLVSERERERKLIFFRMGLGHAESVTMEMGDTFRQTGKAKPVAVRIACSLLRSQIISLLTDLFKRSDSLDCLPVSTPSKPDIAYTVGRLSRHTSSPDPSVLEGYTHASWRTDQEDYASMSGWMFTLGGGALSWGSKKQNCLTDSTIATDFWHWLHVVKKQNGYKTYCLGRRLGPKLLGRGDDSAQRLVKDMYKILNQVNTEQVPAGLTIPDNFTHLVSELKTNTYTAEDFAVMLKGMPPTCHLSLKKIQNCPMIAKMERSEREIRESKLQELMNKHFAASSIPKGIHCLSLRLTDEYSSNAHARRQLPSPELLPVLSDNSYYHFILATDNILAASVVVTSAVQSSLTPEKIVFHVITDKKTYAGMHSWFALNPISPAIIEVKGVHQFDWLTRDNVPVLEAVENHNGIRNYYHGNHVSGANLGDTSLRLFASKLQARSPKYISLLNHLRIYLPELFPNLEKVVFLDDDVVIQRDLSRLWEIDLNGKVNGAVETCKGEDAWVMSKRFRNYFNFSHPLIAKSLDPKECAWAYGMNVFDLRAWRKTNIRETYHAWLKENLRSNLTLWKLGTLPPALIAFRGHVQPIEPSWHMLGLGYQKDTSIESVPKAAVIHYNGQSKPWLQIVNALQVHNKRTGQFKGHLYEKLKLFESKVLCQIHFNIEARNQPGWSLSLSSATCFFPLWRKIDASLASV